jgi:hypothetical protein
MCVNISLLLVNTQASIRLCHEAKRLCVNISLLLRMCDFHMFMLMEHTAAVPWLAGNKHRLNRHCLTLQPCLQNMCRS